MMVRQLMKGSFKKGLIAVSMAVQLAGCGGGDSSTDSAASSAVTASSATCPVSRGRAATRPAAPTRVVGAPPEQPVAEVVSAATLAAGRTAPVRCRNSIRC